LYSLDNVLNSFDKVLYSLDNVLNSFDNALCSLDNVLNSFDNALSSLDNVLSSVANVLSYFLLINCIIEGRYFLLSRKGLNICRKNEPPKLIYPVKD